MVVRPDFEFRVVCFHVSQVEKLRLGEACGLIMVENLLSGIGRYKPKALW